MSEQLFNREEFRAEGQAARSEASPGQPRLRTPVRDQVEFFTAALEDLLPPEHEARVVWELVGELDVSPWLADVKAVEGHVGRDGTTPRLLIGLWVYATLQGIGSARQLATLCREHLAYRWLCGGVSVNHRMLSEFRSAGGEKWDGLLTELIATLMNEGLVTLQRVAQDGMRVRAHAGASSFRRKASLERCREEAREQIEMLRRLAAEDPQELTTRQRAARERAARERAERIASALRQVEEVQQQRDERAQQNHLPSPAAARASTTDPDARRMKMADGGTRPAVNVQFTTDTPSGLIVGVGVTNAGNDQGQLGTMLDQLDQRHGQTPEEALVDGGFAAHEDIEAAQTKHQCRVYAPLKNEQQQLASGQNPYAPKRGDSPIIAQWRARMGTQEGKRIDRLRAQTAEWVNAQARNRGLRQMPVRGLAKCRIVAVLYALAHNLMMAARLRALAALPAA